MGKKMFALAALAFALVFALAVTGCRTDSEVERTKLPSIDGPEKKLEKNKY